MKIKNLKQSASLLCNFHSVFTTPAKVVFFFFILSCLPHALIFGQDPFIVPDILKDNVAFWKRIYTEVSLNQGLIHDNEFPAIVYKKINLEGVAPLQKERLIEDSKDEARRIISEIKNVPSEQWNSKTREIFELFKLFEADNPLQNAENRIRFQQGQCDRFKQGLFRSGAYLDTIRDILAQYHVPSALAYLPHVESSFNADAYSKVGAAGLWQFMRSTGKLYLKIDYSIDERRDPILSTYAAAKLLSHNYSELQSWPLAITAYNHGLNGMKRAVNETGSNDIAVIIARHQSKTFKFASKNFYSCFLAAKEIAENPHTYFPQITFAPPITYKNMLLEYYIRPTALASLTSTTLEQLEKLNPAIRPVVFAHNKQIPKGMMIRIPASAEITEIESALVTLPESLKTTVPEKPTYYTVQRGDNIYSISNKLGISATALMQENNISRKNRIYKGQILTIPSSTVKEVETVVTMTSPTLVAPQDTSSTKQPAPIVKEEPQQPQLAFNDSALSTQSQANSSVSSKEIIPKKNQTLTHQKQIAQAIPLVKPTDSIKDILSTYADTTIAVSVPQTVIQSNRTDLFDANAYNFSVIYDSEKKAARIRISINETMGHYAEWSGVNISKIRSLNRITKNSILHANQEIFLPGSPETIEQFTNKRLEYHMAIEEDFYTQYKVSGLKQVEIAKGQNIWDICNDENEIPLWLIQKYNKNSDFTNLMPHDLLWVPIIVEKTEQDILQERARPNQRHTPSFSDYFGPLFLIQIHP